MESLQKFSDNCHERKEKEMIAMWCAQCEKETLHFYWTCQVCRYRAEGSEPEEDYPSPAYGPSEESARLRQIQQDHK